MVFLYIIGLVFFCYMIVAYLADRVGDRSSDSYEDSQDVLESLAMPKELEATYKETTMYQVEKAWDKENLSETEFRSKYGPHGSTAKQINDVLNKYQQSHMHQAMWMPEGMTYTHIPTSNWKLEKEILRLRKEIIELTAKAPERSRSVNGDMVHYEINMSPNMTQEQFAETARTVFEDLAQLVTVPGPVIKLPTMAYTKPEVDGYWIEMDE